MGQAFYLGKDGVELVHKFKKQANGILLILFLVSSLIGLTACAKEYDHSKDFFALDTIITIRIQGEKNGDMLIEKAIKRIEEIESLMSPSLEDSDVYRVNEAAGREAVKVHDDTLYVVERALEYGEMTQGLFDISVRPIVDLWAIGTKNARIPGADEIEEKLALVDHDDIIIDRDEGTVFLKNEGMGMDLGAIAKGYAADEAARLLREEGVKSALLNLGGNIITIGTKIDGDPWRIGLQDPRSKETGEEHFAIIDVEATTIVSSGDYERYIEDIFKETGKRYHHIFNPKTGEPAETGLMSSVIISQSSIDADALSTILYIMGKDKGLEFIEGFEGVEVILVADDKSIYISEGLKDRLYSIGEAYSIED